MNYTVVLNNSKGLLGKYFCKSYYNLARKDFILKHGRQPEIEDAQEVRDLFEEKWHDYYIGKPTREKLNREKCKEVWRHGIKYKVDVFAAMCRFIEYKYSEFIEYKPPVYSSQLNKITDKHGYHTKSCGDLMKEKNIEFLDGHIIDNGLLNDWKEFIDKNHKVLNKHFKPTYTDYSALAYNGVADDL